MSLRLCSRAPWTTSSSGHERPLYRRTDVRDRLAGRQLERPCGIAAVATTGLAGLAPAAEHEAAEGEAEPEGAGGEAADRDALAPRREALPAAERLRLLGGERLAAALLAQRAAGPNAEIEIVEDLVRLLVLHGAHCSLLRRCHHASSTCPTSISARGTGSTTRPSSGRSAALVERIRPGARGRERRPHPSRHAEPSTRLRPRYLRGLGAPLLVVPGNHDIPHAAAGPLTHPWREFERQWQTTEPAHSSPGLEVVGLNSVRPLRLPGRPGRRRAARAGRGAAAAGAGRARSGSSCSTTSSPARPGARASCPLARAEPRARRGSRAPAPS